MDSNITTPDITVTLSNLKDFFIDIESDLNTVQQRLNLEFNNEYGNKLNPLKISERLKKIQDDLPTLENDLDMIFIAKKDFIEFSKILLDSRNIIQSMQERKSQPIVSSNNDFVLHQYTSNIANWEANLANNNQINFKPTLLLNQKEIEMETKRWEVENQNLNPTPILNTDLESTKPQPIQVPSIKQTTTTTTKQPTKPISNVPLKKKPIKFEPVTESEFSPLGSHVRGRVKLEDLNAVYEKIFNYYKIDKNHEGSLTKNHLASLVSQNILGLTGQNMLLTLRTLKYIDINKTTQNILLIDKNKSK
ncbi:hypothetical protein DLAC_08027 [Tieghemostelium lacteum]|uniref:Protein FAM33A n=1 Tax=Tieghemostelium lacteum TaxID=361077 RepID=A0A151ZB09_TIELA|nr:hypothetical protein DLAC_08027 [Tieghemostelium lacteum]|eukprot:KYQ91121.1 hypothetical protein DLAC_08027 [Tieghemostelium lacteum]